VLSDLALLLTIALFAYLHSQQDTLPKSCKQNPGLHTNTFYPILNANTLYKDSQALSVLDQRYLPALSSLPGEYYTQSRCHHLKAVLKIKDLVAQLFKDVVIIKNAVLFFTKESLLSYQA